MSQPIDPTAAPVPAASFEKASVPAPAVADGQTVADTVQSPYDDHVHVLLAVDAAGTHHYERHEDLHVTKCDICLHVDNHPKHGFVLNANTGQETRRHMDCCAPLGCPSCATQLKDANGAKGHELRSHLESLSA